MTKFLYLISLFTLTAMASPSQNIFKIIESVNSSNPETIECLEENEDELFKQCAIDLCGLPEQAKTGTINNANIDQFLDQDTKQKLTEIAAPTKKIFNDQKNDALRFISELKTRVQKKSLTNFKDWNAEDYSQSTSLYWPFMQPMVDYEKPVNERLTYKLNIPENANANFKKGLEAYRAELIKNNTLDIISGMMIDLYTPDEIKEHINTLKNKIKKSSAQNKDKNSSQVDFNLKLKVFEESLKDVGEDYEKLKGAYFGINQIYNEIKMASNEPFSKAPVFCKEIACRKGLEDHIRNIDFKSTLKELETISKFYEPETEIDRCQAQFINNQLEVKDTSKFQGYLPEVKKMVLKNGMKGFSEHSQEAFKNYLDKELNFYFGNSSNSYDLLEELKSKSKETPEPVKYNEFPNSTFLNYLSNYYMDPYTGRTMLPITVCDYGSSANAIWDHYIPSEYIKTSPDQYKTKGIVPEKDNIGVSPFTCTHEHEGQGILAHEMGHALSYVFQQGKLSTESKSAYAEIRKCSTRQYENALPAEESGSFHWPGDTIYSEEDTADIFSYKALGKGNQLFSCGLLSTDKEGKEFIDLILFDETSDDPHSQGFLRLLREAAYRRDKIPSSCQRIINKNRDIIKAQLCL